MNDGLIPNRYAKALYKLSQERGDTAAVYQEMKQLDVAYASESGLKKAVNNPFLPVADKLKLLCAASGGKLDGTSARFMELVIKNNRIDFLRSIALAFMRQYREPNGIAKVEVVTATQLGDDEINDIVDVVKEQLKLLKFRNTNPAFGFDSELNISNEGSVMTFTWKKDGHEATLRADFSDYSYEIK